MPEIMAYRERCGPRSWPALTPCPTTQTIPGPLETREGERACRVPVSNTLQADAVGANGDRVGYADVNRGSISTLIRGVVGHNGIVLRNDHGASFATVLRRERPRLRQEALIPVTPVAAGGRRR
jgi:hypothetical protein